jgi:hypothetical protein
MGSAHFEGSAQLLCLQNDVRLRLNTREDYKIYMGENGMYGCNVKAITVNTTCNVYDSIHSVSEGQITQRPTAVIG